MPPMTEKLVPLDIPPGIYRNGTLYQAKGRWYDGNLIRWYEKIMGPIGGWRKVLNLAQTAALQITGLARGVHGWRDNSKVSWLAIGTQTKLYAYSDGVLNDITPAALVAGQTNGSFNSGGYGQGTYGTGYYGTGSGALTLFAADTWQLDNFGEVLIATLTSDGRIFTWTPGDPVAVALSADTPPTNNLGVVVTPERFLVALGGTPFGSSTEDARLVRWADQESTTVWTPADTNAAGDFELPTKGRLMCGRRTRRQTMLWTDVDLYAMTYIDGSSVYAFEQLGDNCGIISPNACVVLGDQMMWMSHGKFFIYDGALNPLQCDVLDHVFRDETTKVHALQRAKVAAVANTLYDEIVWFYVSQSLLNGNEPDRYVAYNYREKHWTVGKLNRNGGIDRGVFEYPVWVGTDGFIYEHEIGDDRTGADAAFAVSGPYEIGEGDQLVIAQRFIPDEKTLGDVDMTLFFRKYPTSVETSKGPYTASEPTSVRGMGREVRVEVTEVNPTRWRVGIPRLGVIPGPKR